MKNVLRTHTDRTRTLLLIVLALCGLLSFGVTSTMQMMAQDIPTASVETRFWPGWGQDVTLVHWHQQPTDPELTYTRIWRIGMNKQANGLLVTAKLFTVDIGDTTAIEADYTQSACYMLEQGSGTDHQPRRFVWIGCAR